MSRGVWIIVAVAFMGSGASAQIQSCTTTSGGCFEAKTTPGCEQPECCDIICNDLGEISCCDTAWDQACADAAKQLCDPPACPGEGSCFTAHDTPGCDDESCCWFICTFDGFCCFASWDTYCVTEAIDLCGRPAPVILIPPDAQFEVEACGEHLNDGCNVEGASFDTIPCGEVRYGSCSTDQPRDSDWYQVHVDGESRLAISMIAEFPVQVLLLEGDCLGVIVTRASLTLLPGASETLEACVPGGDYWVFVSAGGQARNLHSGIPCEGDPDAIPGFYGNHYRLEVGCSGCTRPIPGDINNDGVVNGADLGLLLAAWGGTGSADLNGDRVIDGADLGILLANWTA